MTANTSLLLSNPDFPSRLASLKAFLRAQDRYKDYDFEGSNLSVFLELLAYNSYQDAFLASMAATEMFKDTAQLKSSVISRAKELGYVPRSMRSAGAYVNLEIVPTDAPGTITLPKGQAFYSTVGTRLFTFTTEDSIVIYPNTDGKYLASNVNVFEGFYVSEVFTYEGGVSNQLFTLSNEGVDTRSIEVTVDGVPYTLGTTLVTLNASSPVYFIQLGNDSRFQIYFGDNILGASPTHQAEIVVRYRVTVGSAANGARDFSISGPIGGYSNVAITTVSPAVGGAAAENVESIRRNCSIFYAARNRAVTANDYAALLQLQFPEITSINVYGGEEVNPPEYGKVFICVDIEGADGAPQSSQDEYLRYIKAKSPVTIQPVFVAPSFLDLVFDVKVYYDYINYNVSESDIAAAVSNTISSYNANYLNTFNTTFKHSHFVKTIDSAHDAIISNEASVSMALHANTSLLSTQTQKLYFDNPLNTSLESISSSTFSYNGLTCRIRDDRAGSLQIITNVQSATPTIVTSIGTVDYATGEVTLNPIAFSSLSGSGLRIYGKALSSNINAVKNTIIKVATGGVTITPVPTAT